jgi:GntR family transcriptional regulator
MVYYISVHHMPPLTIQVDTAGEIPAYRQIADQIRALIVEGALKSGDRLPSIRRLAIDLGIHFNTVAEAYRGLAREGLLDITHGHGARVTGGALAAEPDPEAAGLLHRRLRDLVGLVRTRGLSAGAVAAELRRLANTLEAGA